jgi:methylated-DNA-[protein]-cysteine S-methyltransferase
MEQLFIAQSGETRLGRFWLAASEHGLAAVSWGQDQPAFEAWLTRRRRYALQPDDARLEEAALQLQEYLDGERRNFTLPIDWSLLRPFQQIVLKATYAIPYGETRTYKEIAALVDRPRSSRAVGRAEATNPMPLVIPCHRVIGSDGKLHGYGMGEGLKTKAWLLRMEGAVMA